MKGEDKMNSTNTNTTNCYIKMAQKSREIIPLNPNELNAPIKIHRVAG